MLVAPVLDEGATSRDIYLPAGRWRDEADPAHAEYDGPITLEDYQADLFTLPYFTRISAKNDADVRNREMYKCVAVIVLALAAVVM